MGTHKDRSVWPHLTWPVRSTRDISRQSSQLRVAILSEKLFPCFAGGKHTHDCDGRRREQLTEAPREEVHSEARNAGNTQRHQAKRGKLHRRQRCNFAGAHGNHQDERRSQRVLQGTLSVRMQGMKLSRGGKALGCSDGLADAC